MDLPSIIHPEKQPSSVEKKRLVYSNGKMKKRKLKQFNKMLLTTEVTTS